VIRFVSYDLIAFPPTRKYLQPDFLWPLMFAQPRTRRHQYSAAESARSM